MVVLVVNEVKIQNKGERSEDTNEEEGEGK